MTQPNAKLVEVARAICDSYYGEGEFDQDVEDGQEDKWLTLARAAIRALMEPSKDMLVYAQDTLDMTGDAETVWRAMLAQVLEEEG